MKRVLVVLGSGYGGLVTAIKLEEKVKRLKNVEIVLVDKNDYHQYLHLAYEVVSGVKKPSDLTVPLSELLSKRKIQFVQATVLKIDFANKLVLTDKGELSFCELVVALGSEPNFYCIKGAEEYAYCVCSVEAAALIRDRLKMVLRKKEGNIVVGGGGFTGVEVAGEILDEYKCCVTIIEGAKALLPSWDIPEFSTKVKGILTEMGAKIVLGKCIKEVKPNAIVLDDDTEIECRLFIWTGGIRGSSVVSRSEMQTGSSCRAIINEFCEAVGHSGVYVVGDSALVVDSKTGAPLPQCAEIAIEMAEVVATNLHADITGCERTVFVPKFNGLILAVGEKYGIGKISGVTVEGKIAQMIKRMIYLRYVYQIAGLEKVIKETL